MTSSSRLRTALNAASSVDARPRSAASACVAAERKSPDSASSFVSAASTFSSFARADLTVAPSVVDVDDDDPGAREPVP